MLVPASCTQGMFQVHALLDISVCLLHKWKHKLSVALTRCCMQELAVRCGQLEQDLSAERDAAAALHLRQADAHTQWQGEAAQLNAALEVSQTRVAELTSELAEAAAAAATAQQALANAGKESAREAERLNERIAELSRQLAEAAERESHLHTSLQQVQQQAKDSDTALSAHQHELSKARAELAGREGKVQGLKQALSETSRLVAQLQEADRLAREQHEAQLTVVSELTAEQEAAKEREQQQAQEFRRLQEANQLRGADLQQLREQLSQREGEVTELQAALDRAGADRQATEAALLSKAVELQLLQEESAKQGEPATIGAFVGSCVGLICSHVRAILTMHVPALFGCALQRSV